MVMIFSADPNWAIGYKNELLFRVSGDMKRFRKLTSGNTVIMGRNTLLSLPGGLPLKNRTNIILSREPGLKIEGATVCGGLDELFTQIENTDPDNVFVMGGEQIYRLLLPHCQKALVTKWDKPAPAADSFMENLDESPDWILAETSEPHVESGIGYTFNTYIRRA